MNLSVLNNITPIKLEDGQRRHDDSFSSVASNCSYFNINEWEKRGEDVPDASNIFISPSPCIVSPHNDAASTPLKASETKKSLFSKNVISNGSTICNNDNSIALSQEGTILC